MALKPKVIDAEIKKLNALSDILAGHVNKDDLKIKLNYCLVHINEVGLGICCDDGGFLPIQGVGLSDMYNGTFDVGLMWYAPGEIIYF